jgi:DNA-binding response OmpR family regulator
MPLILLVDDDPVLLDILTDVLSQEAFRVLRAETLESMADIVAHITPNLVICDLWLSGTPIDDLVAHLSRLAFNRRIPIVLLTGANERDWPDRSLFAANMKKPFDLAELIDTIRRLLSRSNGANSPS